MASKELTTSQMRNYIELADDEFRIVLNELEEIKRKSKRGILKEILEEWDIVELFAKRKAIGKELEKVQRRVVEINKELNLKGIEEEDFLLSQREFGSGIFSNSRLKQEIKERIEQRFPFELKINEAQRLVNKEIQLCRSDDLREIFKSIDDTIKELRAELKGV